MIDSIHHIWHILAWSGYQDFLRASMGDVYTCRFPRCHFPSRLHDERRARTCPIDISRVSLREKVNQAAPEQEGRWGRVVGCRQEVVGVVGRSVGDFG